MTAEQGNLKPCPFCGGAVQLETVKSRAGTLYGVVCRNTGNRGCTCAMEQVPSRSAEAAIARWNMRKPEDDLRAEIEALRKDAERYRWLRDKSAEQFDCPVAFIKERVERIKFADGGQDEGTRYVGPLIGNALDACMDAAMAKEGR